MKPSVAFMVGHDDDAMPESSAGRGSRAGRGSEAGRASRWAGLQSDVAIVSAIRAFFPELATSIVTTTEQLLATDASVVVVLSYYTQPSFAWYATFFAALRALEARGTTVYPSCAFKQFISSKAEYIRLLQSERLPMCPTEVLERSECVDGSGALSLARVHSQLATSLRRLRMLSEHRIAPVLVTKPSNADGGYGVAFWESGGRAGSEPTSELENADLQHHTSETSAAALGAECPPAALLQSLRLHTLLSNGCKLPPSLGGETAEKGASAEKGAPPGAGAGADEDADTDAPHGTNEPSASKRQRVEESASVNAHGSEMGRRPEASRSPHSHPQPRRPFVRHSSRVSVPCHV